MNISFYHNLHAFPLILLFCQHHLILGVSCRSRIWNGWRGVTKFAVSNGFVRITPTAMLFLTSHSHNNPIGIAHHCFLLLHTKTSKFSCCFCFSSSCSQKHFFYSAGTGLCLILLLSRALLLPSYSRSIADCNHNEVRCHIGILHVFKLCLSQWWAAVFCGTMFKGALATTLS